MRNLEWADVDIEDELTLIETLLQASLHMNCNDDGEQETAIALVDKVLIRVRGLKAALEATK